MIGRVANNTNQIDKYKSLRQKNACYNFIGNFSSYSFYNFDNVGASEISFIR